MRLRDFKGVPIGLGQVDRADPSLAADSLCTERHRRRADVARSPIPVGLAAPIALVLLRLAGRYLFVLPYAAEWQGNQRVASRHRAYDRRQALGSGKGSCDANCRPIRLGGGNPRIVKPDGDAPVQADIAAMAGWKSGLGKRIGALVAQTVPAVRKAVRWNSPFYGAGGQGWFLSFPVFSHCVKETFFQGMWLQPVPHGGTARSKQARWIDLRETGLLDEVQMAECIKQAAALPGWTP
jgi:hypothetical protein